MVPATHRNVGGVIRSDGMKVRLPLMCKRLEALLYADLDEQGQPKSEALHARIIMSDFLPTGVGLFLPSSVIVGQLVAIQVTQPCDIVFRGRVIECEKQIIQSRIIKESPLPYRTQVQFYSGGEEEDTQIRSFCTQVYQMILRQEGGSGNQAPQAA